MEDVAEPFPIPDEEKVLEKGTGKMTESYLIQLKKRLGAPEAFRQERRGETK